MRGKASSLLSGMDGGVASAYSFVFTGEAMAKQTFKDRLKILMGKDRPYTWGQKAGIQKGVFAHYWAQERMPTYLRLLKIQNYTGCSLDWLISGQEVNFDRLEELAQVDKKAHGANSKNTRLTKAIVKLKKIYSTKSDRDIARLELFIETVVSAKKERHGY